MYMYVHLARLLTSNATVLEAPGALRKKMVARRFLPRGPLSLRGSTTHGPGGTLSASLAQGAPLQPGGLSTYLARGAPLQPGGLTTYLAQGASSGVLRARQRHALIQPGGLYYLAQGAASVCPVGSASLGPAGSPCLSFARGALSGRCGYCSATHTFSPGGSIIARGAHNMSLAQGATFVCPVGSASLGPAGSPCLSFARGALPGRCGYCSATHTFSPGGSIIHCPGGSLNILARGAPFIRLGGSASLGPAGSLCLFLPRGHFKGAEESAAPWTFVARGAF